MVTIDLIDRIDLDDSGVINLAGNISLFNKGKTDLITKREVSI